MDSRRVPRTVSDPKVRQVGFFAPPDRSQSGPFIPFSSSPPVSDLSPSGNSLSPVMIPPPRHLSVDVSLPRPGNLHPAPLSPLRRDSIPLGSYNPSEFSSPTTTNLPDDSSSPGWHRRGSSGKFATSLPSAGFELPAAKQNSFTASRLTTVSKVNAPLGLSDKDGELKKERNASSKPLKEKTTKAERRALQEAQRAAKAAAKGEGTKTASAASENLNPVKIAKSTSQKKEIPPVAAPEKKSSDRATDKDRKKDVPHPRMQFDDKSRVEKAKKRSVVKQTEAKNRVELFRHLPQYEHGTRLPELESRFFQLDPVHPAVFKAPLNQYGECY